MSRAREFADLAGSADAGGLTGRNLIINGGMQVAQRGTSETGVTTTGVFVTDRFNLNVADTAEYTISQSTTTPDDFAYSLKWDNTVANASPSSGQYAQMYQRIEAQDLQHLKYGTASAQSLTLSFWVRSNKTGTYICEFYQHDSTRHINKAYTISSADTWEHKTITIPGDTSGTINNDNGSGLQIGWWLGAGSSFTSGTLQTDWGALDNTARAVGQVNLSDSTSNEWYITGVQLEVGEKATPFEHRSYGDELRRCQRYYTEFQGNNYEISWGTSNSGSIAGGMIDLPVTMRASPTLATTDGAGNSGKCSTLNGGGTSTNNVSFNQTVTDKEGIRFRLYNNGANGVAFKWTASAEL